MTDSVPSLADAAGALAAISAFLSQNAPAITLAEADAADIAAVLADFDVPGAAIAGQVIADLPTLIALAQAVLPLLAGGFAAFAAAPSPSPIGGDPSFSRGR